jgi:glutamine synthetase
MLAAGLKDVEEDYPLLDPVEEDIYEMDEAAREKEGIASLPGNLFVALQEVEKSALVRDTLGDHIFEKFLANKRIEWDRYRTHVSQYEIEQYLPFL